MRGALVALSAEVVHRRLDPLRVDSDLIARSRTLPSIAASTFNSPALYGYVAPRSWRMRAMW